MIYYVCKYTPVELLRGFDTQTARLEPSAESFDTAESLGHVNMCGYVKAALEEIYQKDIQEMVLVNCCDMIRRLYDILKMNRKMDFLYLLDLPHTNGPGEVKRFARCLEDMADEYAASTGKTFDVNASLAAFEESEKAETVTGATVNVMGAHGSGDLIEMIENAMPMPVENHTCTGNRRIKKPENSRNFFEVYADRLLSQTPCMRMHDISKRQDLEDDTNVGIVYHTVKFCDYYSFEYADLKNSLDIPLLKIETDCTLQSEGQMKTRLEAFSETISLKGQEIKSKGNNEMSTFAAGIDSGSTSTDVVILDKKKNIAGWAIVPTGVGAAAGAEKALEAAAQNAGIGADEIGVTVSTGYGRENIGKGDVSITEITCHAKGAHYLNPNISTVIDIGGQDSKVIKLDHEGGVENFVMNDKCAAGTGRFLDMMARTMELSLEDMSRMGLEWKKDVVISSMCTVFAESEVVSLVAQNTAPEDIIHGLNKAVAAKTVSLVRRLGGKAEFLMTGGVAKNNGVVRAISEKLGEEVQVSEQSQLCGAIGAALFGLEQMK